MRFAHTTRLFENALLIHLSIGGGGSRAVVDDPERSFARDDDDDSTDSISTRLRMFLSFFLLFIYLFCVAVPVLFRTRTWWIQLRPNRTEQVLMQ
jgi:hypothetical protein